MAKALLALLLAAVVLAISAWHFGVLSEPVEVCEIDKNTRERVCAVHSAAIGTLIQVGAFLERYGDAIIAVVAVVLAISTILLWRATHRLAAALHAAGERQIAIAQQSADAATKAAAAAEASVKTMTETAQRQLRAYVSVQTTLMELLEPQEGSLHSDHDQEHRSDPGA